VAAFIYRCPATGFIVQGWSPDDTPPERGGTAYELVTCTACKRSHLVNPRSGQVLGADEPAHQRGI
jgi:hypothetical protein